MAEGREWVIIN